MSFEQIATFHIVLYFKTLIAAWRHRHWYQGQARHRTSYIGTNAAIRASDIVWQLRNERRQPIFHRMHDDTETLVLT